MSNLANWTLIYFFIFFINKPVRSGLTGFFLNRTGPFALSKPDRTGPGKQKTVLNRTGGLKITGPVRFTVFTVFLRRPTRTDRLLALSK